MKILKMYKADFVSREDSWEVFVFAIRGRCIVLIEWFDCVRSNVGIWAKTRSAEMWNNFISDPTRQPLYSWWYLHWSLGVIYSVSSVMIPKEIRSDSTKSESNVFTHFHQFFSFSLCSPFTFIHCCGQDCIL